MDLGTCCIRLTYDMVSNSSQAPASADNSVATRYGDTKRPRVSKTTRRVIAIMALVAAVAITVWFAFSASSRMLTAKTVGYEIHNEAEAWVEFELTKESEATVGCAVRVLTETVAGGGYMTVFVVLSEDLAETWVEITYIYTKIH